MKKKQAQPKVSRISHRFFKGIPAKYEKLIQANARVITLPRGENVFENGRPANSFFLILKGKVHLLAEEQDIRFDPEAKLGVLQELGPGEVVGWSWVIKPYRWRFFAAAHTDVRMLIVDGVALRKAMAKDHLFAYEIYKRLVPVMNDRLIASRQRLQMFGAKPYLTAEGA
ncbi:MAG: Crp/Fnr family transcriptional regulator [Candidatus Omnitrophica bacterium]|nr:Crp/Fnr family transcriptional regulator [Candidatus Omnitrophota bacterium]